MERAGQPSAFAALTWLNGRLIGVDVTPRLKTLKVVEPGKPTVYFDTWDEARQYCQSFAPRSIPEAADTEPGTGAGTVSAPDEPDQR